MSYADFAIGISGVLYGVLAGYAFSKFGVPIQELSDVPLDRLCSLAQRAKQEEMEKILWNFLYLLPIYPALFVSLYSESRKIAQTLLQNSESEWITSKYLREFSEEFGRQFQEKWSNKSKLPQRHQFFIWGRILFSLLFPPLVLLQFWLEYRWRWQISCGEEVAALVFLVLVGALPLVGYYMSVSYIQRTFFNFKKGGYSRPIISYWLLLICWLSGWFGMLSGLPVLLLCIPSVVTIFATWFAIKGWGTPYFRIEA
jgi:hypothetical protein